MSAKRLDASLRAPPPSTCAANFANPGARAEAGRCWSSVSLARGIRPALVVLPDGRSIGSETFVVAGEGRRLTVRRRAVACWSVRCVPCKVMPGDGAVWSRRRIVASGRGRLQAGEAKIAAGWLMSAGAAISDEASDLRSGGPVLAVVDENLLLIMAWHGSNRSSPTLRELPGDRSPIDLVQVDYPAHSTASVVESLRVQTLETRCPGSGHRFHRFPAARTTSRDQHRRFTASRDIRPRNDLCATRSARSPTACRKPTPEIGKVESDSPIGLQRPASEHGPAAVVRLRGPSPDRRFSSLGRGC